MVALDYFSRVQEMGNKIGKGSFPIAYKARIYFRKEMAKSLGMYCHNRENLYTKVT